VELRGLKEMSGRERNPEGVASNRIGISESVVIAGLLALILAFSGCAGKSEKRDQFLQKGIRLYEAGEYKKAVLQFTNALQLDPDFAPGYFFVGKAYYKQQNIKKALACFSKALELDEGLDEARMISGMILVTAKEGEKALERITPVLEKDPASARALLIAAQACVLLEKPDKAIGNLNGIKQSGRNKEALLAFADAYRLKGEMRFVKEYLARYQETAPDDPVSYELLSGIYAEERQPGKGEAQLRELIKRRKGDPFYRLRLCRFFVETGQEGAAKAEFERMIEENFRENRYKLAYAEFLIERKRFNQAQAVLTAAVRNTPNSWKERTCLVKVFLAQGKQDDALKQLDDFLRGNSEQGRVEALLKKGEILSGLDRHGEAMMQCNLALAIESVNPYAQLLKGKVLLQKGKFYEAIVYLRQVVDRKPSEPEGHILLARALAASGNRGLAIEDLKRGLKELPHNTALRMELITCYEKEKEWENALEEANAGMEESPGNLFFLVRKGRMLIALKKSDEAENVFEEIIRRQPRESIGYFELGRLRMAAGDSREAGELFAKASSLEKDARSGDR
jgi:predicted Zn-dependent protease